MLISVNETMHLIELFKEYSNKDRFKLDRNDSEDIFSVCLDLSQEIAITYFNTLNLFEKGELNIHVAHNKAVSMALDAEFVNDIVDSVLQLQPLSGEDDYGR